VSSNENVCLLRCCNPDIKASQLDLIGQTTAAETH
jgi:hypothetical protein